MNTARRSIPLRTRAVQSAALAGFVALLAANLTACKSDPAAAPIVNNNAAADVGGPDPAAANMASGVAAYASGQPTRVAGQSQSYMPQQQAESYTSGEQAPAPIVRGSSQAYAGQQGYVDPQGYSQGDANGQGSYDQGYADGEQAEANTAPPPLPVYDQPPAPDPNDIWTPGYWNYAQAGYYWVPGTWVAAPYYGALWTPPFWGWNGGHYRLHRGYWGPHVGYYGGIDYGFGYIGTGYYGGYWRGHDFYYNRAVNHVNVVNVRNVYNRTVIVNNVTYNERPSIRTSYNGGPGGIQAQPRPFEIAAEREHHTGPQPGQVALRQQAAGDRGNFFAQNQGRPAQTAFTHPPSGAISPVPVNNGAPFSTRGPAGQPFNRGGVPENTAPGTRPGQPAANPGFRHDVQPPSAGVGASANPGFNRSAEPGYRPGAPNGVPGFNHPTPATPTQPGRSEPGPGFNRQSQPAAQPNTPNGNPGFHRGDPAGRPGGFNNGGGFNNPSVNRPQPEVARPAPSPTPAPAPQPRVGPQPRSVAPATTPGFNQPAMGGGPGMNRSAPGGGPGFSRQPGVPHADAARPAPQPHVQAVQPAPAQSAPHVEIPHPAAAPHADAPHPAAPAAAPHNEGGRPR